MKRLVIFILLVTSGLLAKDYALIVGVANYQNIGGLSHIESDIAIYNKILESRGVTKDRVTILRDNKATRAKIRHYLADVVQKMKKSKDDNNRFFMFFSGHGVNTSDIKYGSKIQENGLDKYLTNSGVILPYEFDENNIAKTIIIGKRDLRPYLIEIDKHVKSSLIVFDACYSGDSIKGTKKRKSTPFVYSNPKDFPYKNIVYIAAATSKSKAKSGVLSKVLNNCLIQQTNLNQLRVCMNNRLMYVGQRAVVVSR